MLASSRADHDRDQAGASGQAPRPRRGAQVRADAAGGARRERGQGPARGDRRDQGMSGVRSVMRRGIRAPTRIALTRYSSPGRAVPAVPDSKEIARVPRPSAVGLHPRRAPAHRVDRAGRPRRGGRGHRRLALLGWLLARVIAGEPLRALAVPAALTAAAIVLRGALDYYRDHGRPPHGGARAGARCARRSTTTSPRSAPPTSPGRAPAT